MHIGYIGETRRQQTEVDGAIPREVELTNLCSFDPVTTESYMLEIVGLYHPEDDKFTATITRRLLARG